MFCTKLKSKFVMQTSQSVLHACMSDCCDKVMPENGVLCLFSDYDETSGVIATSRTTHRLKPRHFLLDIYVDDQPATLINVTSGCRNIVARKGLVKDGKSLGKYEAQILYKRQQRERCSIGKGKQ